MFEHRPGYFRETEHARVMTKVDAKGNVLGFSVLGFSAIGDGPLEVML
jgi:hypothetical protein